MIAPSPVRKHRILVVDDEAAVLDNYRSTFQPVARTDPAGDALRSLEGDLFGAGSTEPATVRRSAPAEAPFDLAMCRQGEEAVAAVERALAAGTPFEIAFLDVRMPPGIDGIETAQRLRALDPDLHIAIVTGFSDTRPEEASQRVAPADKLFWFQKPFRAIELRQLVLAVCAKRDLERSLRDFCAELEERVAARTRECETARLEAEAASRAKSRFLANMSHELRTPLNAVIGFAELLTDECFGTLTAKQREYIADIHSSGEHLLRVVSDILDLARVEEDRLSLDREPVDLGHLIRACRLLIDGRAAEKRIAVTTTLDAKLGPVDADAVRLKQILLNLLSNAVKFTPEGGRITVAAKTSGGHLTLEVSDTGIGMTAEEVRTALEPFGQIDNLLARRHEGAGLGLPLAKALTEAHGGWLEITSAVGRGTAVRIVLPAPQPALATARDRLATG